MSIQFSDVGNHNINQRPAFFKTLNFVRSFFDKYNFEITF